MAKIFISYRRADSAASAGRIYDHLVAKFGRKNIFKDVDDIPAGVNFAQYIQDSLRQCAVELVIIGPAWAQRQAPDGTRRLDDPRDFVRLEVETGLTLGLSVVPVLVENAAMPSERDLPESLQPLLLINALQVRHDPDFSRDMDRTIESVERIIAARPGSGVGRRGAQASHVPTAPEPLSSPTPSRAASSTEERAKQVGERPLRGPLPGVLSAGLAVVLLVASFGALLASGHLPWVGASSPTAAQLTQTAHARPGATRTASATSTSTGLSLPYTSTAPGCNDKATWSMMPDASVAECHSGVVTLTVPGECSSSNCAYANAALDMSQFKGTTPTSETVQVQMGHFTTNAIVTIDWDYVTTSYTAINYTLTANRYGAYSIDRQQGSTASGRVGSGTLDPSAMTSVTWVDSNEGVHWTIGTQTNGFADPGPLVLQAVQLHVTGGVNESADFSGFSITPS